MKHPVGSEESTPKASVEGPPQAPSLLNLTYDEVQQRARAGDTDAARLILFIVGDCLRRARCPMPTPTGELVPAASIPEEFADYMADALVRIARGLDSKAALNLKMNAGSGKFARDDFVCFLVKAYQYMGAGVNQSYNRTADYLADNNIKPPRAKSVWTSDTIRKIVASRNSGK